MVSLLDSQVRSGTMESEDLYETVELYRQDDGSGGKPSSSDEDFEIVSASQTVIVSASMPLDTVDSVRIFPFLSCSPLPGVNELALVSRL